MTIYKNIKKTIFFKSTALYTLIITVMVSLSGYSQNTVSNPTSSKKVPQKVMEEVFNEIKTPYKYGVVFKHPDSTKLIDSPTIF